MYKKIQPMLFVSFIIMIGVFSSTITATTYQAYAQGSNRRATNEIIPITDILNNAIECPNGELIQISGDVHIATQFIQDEQGDHQVIHVNWQHMKGEGLTSGNHYTVQNVFNSPSNFVIRSGSATGTMTQETNFRIIGQGPSESAVDFTLHASAHITVNANGQTTVFLTNERFECR